MKRIDLRYPIVIAAFYAPGLMMLIGAWVLGYSTDEARVIVAPIGATIGFIVSADSAENMFGRYGTPIWWIIPRRKGGAE